MSLVSSRGLLWLVVLSMVLFPSLGLGDVVRLLPDGPQEQPLAEGESQVYVFELDRGHYLEVRAWQQNVDLRLVLRDPSGKEIQNVDDQFLGGRHPETLIWISQEEGEYRLEVHGVVGQGQYRLAWAADLDVVASADLRRRMEAERLVYRGLGLQQRPEHSHCRSAIEAFEQTLSTWAEIGDGAQEASTRNNIGYCRNRLEEYESAVDSFERALRVIPDGLEQEKAQILQNLALARRRLGRFGEAAAGYREAISIFQQLGLKVEEGKGWLGLGHTLLEEGETESALEWFAKARPFFDEEGAEPSLASALGHFASALTHLGRVDDALNFLAEAIRETDAGSPAEARVGAVLEAQMGVIYDWVGEPAAAAQHFERSIVLNEALGDRLGEARARRLLGILQRDLGGFEAALLELGRCAALHVALGRARDVAEVRVLVAGTYRRQGELQVASAIIELALSDLREFGSVVDQVEALQEQGLILEASEHFREAGKVYEKAIERLAGRQEPLREGKLLAAAGGNALHLENHRRASQDLTAALALSRSTRDHQTEVKTLLHLARLESKRGKVETALQHVEGCLEAVGRVRDRVGAARFRALYLESEMMAHGLAVELLAQRHQREPSRGYDRRAFDISEKMHSRMLRQSAAAAATQQVEGGDEWQVEMRALRRQLNAREHFLLTNGRLSDRHRRSAAQEIGGLLRRLRDTEAKMLRRNRDLAWWRRAETMPSEEVQRDLLGEDTVLLEFILGQERSHIWALTHDTLRMAELPPGKDLEVLVGEFLRLLTLPGEPPGQQTQSERRAWEEQVRESERLAFDLGIQLSEALLEPVADLLTARRVVVVAHGALRQLPFGALPEPGETADAWLPLLANHTLVNVPSASIAGALRNGKAPRQEVTGWLLMFENPAMFEDPAHIEAGSAWVLAGLWQIDEDITDEFKERMNLGLQEKGLAPAEAFRQAVEFLRKQPRNSDGGHPYSWAGFVMVGDWR